MPPLIRLVYSPAATLVPLAIIVLGGCIQDPAIFTSAGEDVGLSDDADEYEGDTDVDEGDCDDHETVCGGNCVDLQSDRNHCGTCGLACTTDLTGGEAICDEGSCTDICPGGFTRCPDDDGDYCTNTQTDPENCGFCGTDCPTGVCTSGACAPYGCEEDEEDADGFGGGNGTAANPYTICTPEHLQNVDEELSAYFALSKDIDLDGFDLDPIGDFEGNFDGFGFEIRNFSHEASGNNEVGIFSVITDDGVVTNLHLVDVDVMGGESTGALVGENYGTVMNITVTGEVSGDIRVGGVAGRNWGSLSNVTVDGNVAGNDRVGGMVGANTGLITANCTANVGVRAEEGIVGGLSGNNFNHNDHHGQIIGCRAEGDVTSEGPGTGGLVGRNRGLIDDSHATGTVHSSGANTGGLVGLNTEGSESNPCRIEGSSATGEVTHIGDANSIGGLVGRHTSECAIAEAKAEGVVVATGASDVGGLVGFMADDASISDSETSGEITGGDNVGGLVGYMENDSTIADSHATGDVTGQNNVGGLVGYLRHSGNSVERSSATGRVTGGVEHIGGLIGHHRDGRLSQTFATGDVEGQDWRVGGLVGRLENAEIDNSYATGAVSGARGIAGLVGRQDSGPITHSYAAGLVLDVDSSGGLIGFMGSSGPIDASFWDVDTSQQPDDGDPDFGVGIDTATFENQVFFDEDHGWDFDEIWTMPDPSELDVDEPMRPRLQWEFQ